MSFLDDLRRRARKRGASIVFPEGTDRRTLDAAGRLASGGLVRPVLLGPVEEVRRGLASAGGDPDALEIVDPAAEVEAWTEALREVRWGAELDDDARRSALSDPLVVGALMVRTGRVDGSVAGAVHATPRVVRAAIRCVGPAPGVTTISSSFYMVVRPFRGRGEEVLTFTDAGVVPDPDPVELAEIARSAARARRRIVGDEPRVAFLSYSTLGSAGGPSVEKVREAVERFRQTAPEVEADGELQADAALIEAVAERKAPNSGVAGRANVLVFPDLDAANIAYKLVQRLAGATALGPILQGLRRPCNDLSRGATANDVADVACVTAVDAPERDA